MAKVGGFAEPMPMFPVGRDQIRKCLPDMPRRPHPALKTFIYKIETELALAASLHEVDYENLGCRSMLRWRLFNSMNISSRSNLFGPYGSDSRIFQYTNEKRTLKRHLPACRLLSTQH